MTGIEGDFDFVSDELRNKGITVAEVLRLCELPPAQETPVEVHNASYGYSDDVLGEDNSAVCDLLRQGKLLPGLVDPEHLAKHLENHPAGRKLAKFRADRPRAMVYLRTS